jgi:hypothetical protein
VSTDRIEGTERNGAPVAGCMMCKQVFDPNRIVVYDTDHFVGYVTPIYPWAVMVTTRRHECDGPWALTDAEAIELGQIIPRVSRAIRKTGSERAYILVFGEEAPMPQFDEESPMPHFHMGFLSRYEPLSEAERVVMQERIENSPSEPERVAVDFAAAVRGYL